MGLFYGMRGLMDRFIVYLIEMIIIHILNKYLPKDINSNHNQYHSQIKSPNNKKKDIKKIVHI